MNGVADGSIDQLDPGAEFEPASQRKG